MLTNRARARTSAAPLAARTDPATRVADASSPLHCVRCAQRPSPACRSTSASTSTSGEPSRCDSTTGASPAPRLGEEDFSRYRDRRPYPPGALQRRHRFGRSAVSGAGRTTDARVRGHRLRLRAWRDADRRGKTLRGDARERGILAGRQDRRGAVDRLLLARPVRRGRRQRLSRGGRATAATGSDQERHSVSRHRGRHTAKSITDRRPSRPRSSRLPWRACVR